MFKLAPQPLPPPSPATPPPNHHYLYKATKTATTRRAICIPFTKKEGKKEKRSNLRKKD
jgi:hypothetical protein